MPTCFSEQLMEQSRSAPDGWGWGAAWETRSIIFILHLLLLLLSLLLYYIIVIVIILRMGSSLGNKNNHPSIVSIYFDTQTARHPMPIIDWVRGSNEQFSLKKKITFFTAFPFYQLQSSKTQQVKKRIGCGSHDVPRPRLRCRWSFPGCRCRTKFSGSTHKTLKHDPVTVVIIVEVALNGVKKTGGREIPAHGFCCGDGSLVRGEAPSGRSSWRRGRNATQRGTWD